MTEIEQRVETTAETPDYSGVSFNAEQLASGRHREFVGGKWDSHGVHQLEFLREQGLLPTHRFLDVGCGSLRAGRHLIDYLEPGNYYGVDANLSLLQAGYDLELDGRQRSRLPIANLRMNDRFDADFGVRFDMAIAQSVFTHVSLNHIRLCLYRVAKVMRPGGKFYATFFEHAADYPLDAIDMARKAKMTERNVFWYYRGDLRWASRWGPWRFRYIGGWGHPRGQKMVEFTRLADPPPADGSRRSRLEAQIRRGRRWMARRIDPQH
jgi:SAM-dependent methyltransferase